MMNAATNTPSALRDSVRWSITPIAGSILTSVPANAKGRAVVFTYSGLPDSNSQFGPKYVYAALPQYGVVESVMIKTYFPKYATNHPAPGNGTTPNWYYYWGQTEADTGSHVYGGQYCGSLNEPGYYQDSSLFFHICYLASQKWPVQCAGFDTSDGIDNYAQTCLHESQHLTDFFAWWAPGLYDSTRDSDRDYIPNSVEPQLGYDSTMWDSDRDGYKDWEDHALDRECDWICGDDYEDWANPGHQF
jgi:hypothetical protein